MRARRTRKSRKSMFVLFILLIVVLIIGGGGWYLYTKTYGNSVMKLSTVDYLIATKNGDTDGKIVFIRSMKDKKIVYVVELPEYPFYGDKNIGFDSRDLSFGLQIIKQMFDIDTPDDSYFMTLSADDMNYMASELEISFKKKDVVSLLIRYT